MAQTVEAAREYLARGWRPVPVAGKRPLGEGWADRPRRFSEFEGRNVGVVLGRRSGDLVDIDLDAPEAIELADYYLPRTDAVFGRASKPQAHRLFIAHGTVYEKFHDPFCNPSVQKATLLEIRSDTDTGGYSQTVFPPSVHPESGERTTWAFDGEVRAIDARVLRWRCAVLASSCMIMRYIDPILHQNWSRNWRTELPQWIMGSFPELGAIIYSWLDLHDPITEFPYALWAQSDYQRYLLSYPWHKRRIAVLERAEGVCEQCRIERAWQVHHRTYRHLALSH